MAPLQHADFLVSVDIRDAYLQVLMFLAHHKFLQFSIHDEHFQFLATAPPGIYKSFSPSAGLVKGTASVHPDVSRQPVAQRTVSISDKAKCFSHDSYTGRFGLGSQCGEISIERSTDPGVSRPYVNHCLGKGVFASKREPFY